MARSADDAKLDRYGTFLCAPAGNVLADSRVPHGLLSPKQGRTLLVKEPCLASQVGKGSFTFITDQARILSLDGLETTARTAREEHGCRRSHFCLHPAS